MRWSVPVVDAAKPGAGVARSRTAEPACATGRRIILATPDLRQLRISRTGLLLLSAGAALVLLALSRWDPVGPQSLICRHRDDPKGTINFRVDVGRGDDRVRFADGQTVRVQTSRDRITFLEKEANRFHLSDEDGDEAGLGMLSWEERELGIPAPTAPVVIHVDRGHDVEHRTTIDRRRLTFQEQALTEDGQPGDVMMDGRCRPVAAG
jgi:hypothetical protein